LFRRGGDLNPDLTCNGSKTICCMCKDNVCNFNIAGWLEPSTNDLYISTVTTDKGDQTVVLRNVPVQQPFRLGVILYEKSIEAYINGELAQTKSFPKSVANILGDFYGSSGGDINVALLQNLKIWPSTITSCQIANATPAPPPASDFSLNLLPTSGSTCATNTPPPMGTLLTDEDDSNPTFSPQGLLTKFKMEEMN